MWMAKTCKCLEETKREWMRAKWGGGWIYRWGSANKANQVSLPSLQGCNSLLSFLHPSIPVLKPFLLPTACQQAPALRNQTWKRYTVPSALKKLHFCAYACINIPKRVGRCWPSKVAFWGIGLKSETRVPKCIIKEHLNSIKLKTRKQRQ